MALEEPRLCRPSDFHSNPWLGVRTLEKAWKPPTPEELERSQQFMEEIRNARNPPAPKKV